MQQTKSKYNIIIIVVLISIFCMYNVVIYTSKECAAPIKLTTKALEGQKIWQNNNCWSCHQIYGLGGYLGPDLTNVFSNPNKGENYIKAFLNSGVKSMPKFNFSEAEKEALVAFLQQIDSTGYYPNKEAIIKPNGWVEILYKDEK
ncbi:c-type cytochrome [Ichthyenterobacterium magnum]|uniref:Nitric oxide reductase subunit C n=1 Tax=Ichthyenterobacterium magnum TaxID=1230530 RepID=A0A420DVC0_9FLAO|nr:cytochrome c [Ichthyenterobacterium magnum]RKE98159.1 nitric oxide reductase subunit C [Ichthyenterobacterium magnum]